MKKILTFATVTLLYAQIASAQEVQDTILTTKTLEEIEVSADRKNIVNKTEALNIVSPDTYFMTLNRGNSLMSSLDKIPGVQSVQIGQGLSKPMLRGLGFNRVAVLQNGIKQQGQQWGADHGLEIDQYDVEEIEIYKGATSLQYGSDAIAGVIKIVPSSLYTIDGHRGKVQLYATSNNGLLGGSLDSYYQKNKKYLRGRITYQSFEDYKTPSNNFEYLGTQFPLHKGRLKNTAGRETDLSLHTGWITENNSSNILVSNVYSKTGFFAGSHGTPTLQDLEDDGSHRNIDLPYQSVNHLKVIYNQMIKLNDKQKLEFDLGYQNNYRKEYAEPHLHDDEEELPDSDLELALRLQTVSLNANWINQLNPKSKLTIGINTEYQDNDIAGHAFLIPQFEQLTGGIYAINRQRLSDKLVVTSGIRYDLGSLQIHKYAEDHSDHDHEHGHDHEGETKVDNMTKNSGDFSFSVGASYVFDTSWTMKANIGKSFRMPTTNELTANGIHHGAARYELGDKDLKSETSYQLDYGVEYQKKLNGFVNNIAINTSLFASYFPNYIFLTPTEEFNIEQYYQYTQTEVFRAGGELSLSVDFAHNFGWESGLDFVYAEDVDNKNPIPFTPPFSLTNKLSYQIGKNAINIGHRYTATQNRVTYNELPTGKYHLFDASASTSFAIKKQELSLILQAQNLMNKRYYNHLSFYRYLNIPEMGRNFRLTIILSI